MVNNIDEAVRAIEALLSDSVARQRIGERARQLVVENYSWPSKAKEYETLWNVVASSR